MFLLVISVGGIFYGDNMLWRSLEGICYAIMMLFLYQGFTILNDNYPDTALTTKQKRYFNILFLANFLLIAFLFAKVLVQWRYVKAVITGFNLDARGYLMVLLPLILAVLVFVLNFVYLIGMYRLRITIQENNIRQIEDGFDNNR
jgi:hypothetical protein